MSTAEDLVAALEKAIGPNATQQSVTNFIDTGYPPLNKIMSGRYDGGLPYGRIVECYGVSSAGKCLTADTMLLTEHGLLTIEELYKHEGYLATCVTKNVPHEVGLVNENNIVEKTSHLVWNGRKKVRHIKTKSGNELKSTLNHPIRVMNERGNIVWKLTKDIQVGDYLVTLRGSKQFGNSKLTPDEAKLLGYLIADGSCGETKRIRFSNTDNEVVSEFLRIVKKLTSKKISDKTTVTESGAHRDFAICSKEFRSYLAEKYNLDFHKSATKEVPQIVRMASEESVKSFLRAYFELECSICDRFIEVTSASKTLLQQIKAMLLNLGIVSSINLKRVDGYDHEYWRMYIGGANKDLFVKEIGFETKARLEQCVERPRNIERTYSDVIPYINKHLLDLHNSLAITDRETANLLPFRGEDRENVGRPVLERCLAEFAKQKTPSNEHLFGYLEFLQKANYFYDIVEEIEETEPAPTFDVVMPQSHSFWSNGIVSHNTALATQWMVQAQKLGGIAIFIDWERSFDVELAKSFGLNDERPYWIYSRPETWESGNIVAAKACSLIRDSKLIDPESPILVVFDSVASAVPQSVADKEIDEYTMNDTTALARVASTTLKAMAHHAANFNATFLYLNQVRTKPGVVYGDNITCPGGSAMEFYATVRIQLTRSKLTENKDGGKTFVGQTINIKCTKSKLTKPFQTCSLDMVYDDLGVARFDAVGSTVEYLKDRKVLESSGPRIKWKEKTYFKNQLVEQINKEGGLDVLKPLLP